MREGRQAHEEVQHGAAVGVVAAVVVGLGPEVAQPAQQPRAAALPGARLPPPPLRLQPLKRGKGISEGIFLESSHARFNLPSRNIVLRQSNEDMLPCSSPDISVRGPCAALRWVLQGS